MRELYAQVDRWLECQRLQICPFATRAFDGAVSRVTDQVARERRMHRVGRLVRDRSLDDDGLGPRQPVVELAGERVVATDHCHGDPERSEVESVDRGLA